MSKSYKCTNYGICTEADKGTVFQETVLEEVDGKFVCPKCGQALEEIEKKPGVSRTVICIIAAVLVAAGAVVYFAGFKGKGEAGNGLIPEPVETPTPRPQVDTTAGTDDVPELEGEESDLDVDIKETDQSEKVVKPAKAKPFSLGWGTYVGPMQGGKPHGLGGEITVTKSYSIDMKNGSYKQVTRGDRLVNTKFKEGKLVQGYIHHTSGEQESFTIGY